MLRVVTVFLAVAVVAGQSDEACTPPHTSADSRRPYCFVPDTVSWQAQKLLKTKHVTADLPPGIPAAAVQAIRNSRAAARSGEATAAASAFFTKGSVTNATVSGVRVTWGTPVGFDQAANNDKLLLYFHGGYYMLSSCADHLNVVGPVIKVVGIKMLCVDYPLTPEHPFPAALNDAVAVYKWALGQGYKAPHIALMGDSVGGNLAMSLLLAAAREGLPLPGAVGLMSPRVEMEKRGDTLTTLTAIDPVLQYDRNHYGSALAYVGGDASKLSDPLVSPLRADWDSSIFKKTPFPAVLIQVGLRDTLLSASTMLFRKLTSAGIPCVKFSPWEGMWHVFQAWSSKPDEQLPEALQASQEMGEFLKKHLQGSSVCC